MVALATSVVALSLAISAGGCSGEEVAGYAIYRHEAEGRCSASLMFETAQGRDANITYFLFDDGRMDEVYFGLRPAAVLDPAALIGEPIDVLVDEAVVLTGSGSVDPTGLVTLPNLWLGRRKLLLDAMMAGQVLTVAMKGSEQDLIIDLNGLRQARAALEKCVEDKNVNS